MITGKIKLLCPHCRARICDKRKDIYFKVKLHIISDSSDDDDLITIKCHKCGIELGISFEYEYMLSTEHHPPDKSKPLLYLLLRDHIVSLQHGQSFDVNSRSIEQLVIFNGYCGLIKIIASRLIWV